MTRKRKIITFSLILAFLTPFIALACLWKKITLLREYETFINDPKNQTLLQRTYAVYDWKKEPATPADTISLGYATFNYPITKIGKSMLKGYYLEIQGAGFTLIFLRPKIFETDFHQNHKIVFNKEYEYASKDIWIPGLSSTFTHKQWQEIQSNETLSNFRRAYYVTPFEWHTRVLSTCPQDQKFSLWSQYSDIDYHYAILRNKLFLSKRLESVFSFQTPNIKGIAWDKSIYDPNFLLLNIYDNQTNISQDVYLKCIMSIESTEIVKQLFSSYSFKDQSYVERILRDYNQLINFACQLPNCEVDVERLIWYMESIDSASMKKLIPHIHNLNEKRRSDDSNLTLLHAAVCEGKFDITRLLLEHGAEINSVDKYQETSLYWAVEYGYPEIAEFLLQKGANPNIPNENLQTPLHLAVAKADQEMIELLLSHHADPNARNIYGFTPLALSETEQITDILLPITQVKFQDPNTNDWPVNKVYARVLADRKLRSPYSRSHQLLTNTYDGFYAIIYDMESVGYGYGYYGGYDTKKKNLISWAKVDGFTGEVTLYKSDRKSIAIDDDVYAIWDGVGRWMVTIFPQHIYDEVMAFTVLHMFLFF